MSSPTAHEQYLLELVNRSRLDPEAEAFRHRVDLNEGLAPGEISGDPKQPLAMNGLLVDSARAHSRWMLDTDTFSHTGINGSTPHERMMAAGYEFTGAWRSGENIASRGTTRTQDVTGFVTLEHQDLFVSPGHRRNLLQDDFREVGMGILTGVFTQEGTDFNAVMTTQNFAKSGSRFFLTGVAYQDRDGDAFYSPGEGWGNITVQVQGAGSSSTTTPSAGGYQLQLASGDYTVTFSGGGLSAPIAQHLTLGSKNVKLDLVGPDHVQTSTSLVMADNLKQLTLLGSASIDAAGNALSNRFTGNRGDNILEGEEGIDTAVFSNPLGSYDIFQEDGSFVVADKAGNDGMDTLQNVELFQFSDTLYFAASSQSVDFVAYLYSQFLGRQGDAEGITFWGDQLDQGKKSAAQIVEPFFNVPEFQDTVEPVARLYFASFDRIPDSEGLTFWVDAFRDGAALADLAGNFLTSEEFKARFGENLTDEELVQQLYRNVLHRDGDPEGEDHWVGELENGRPRPFVLGEFSESPENKANTADDIRTALLYEGLLDRPPGETELAEGNDLPLSDLINQLLASEDYAGPPVPGSETAMVMTASYSAAAEQPSDPGQETGIHLVGVQDAHEHEAYGIA